MYCGALSEWTAAVTVMKQEREFVERCSEFGSLLCVYVCGVCVCVVCVYACMCVCVCGVCVRAFVGTIINNKQPDGVTSISSQRRTHESNYALQ